jgi:hypothetical protein
MATDLGKLLGENKIGLVYETNSGLADICARACKDAGGYVTFCMMNVSE